MTKTKRGRGRPCIVNWNKVRLQWRNNTDKELATKLGTSVPNVFLRRRKLIEAANKAGKDGTFYSYKGKPYTRSKYLAQPEVNAFAAHSS